MSPFPPAALPASARLAVQIHDRLDAALWILLALTASALFSALRAALLHAVPKRALKRIEDPDERRRLATLLDRSEALASSAGIFKITCDVVVVTLLLGHLAGEEAIGWPPVLVTLAIAAPTLLLLTEALPASIARAHGDGLLIAVLPVFRFVQSPVSLLVAALDGLRRAVLRTLHISERSPEARRLVEGLREMIEDSAGKGELEETERVLIENVMDFGDVDAAEVMTPRTEIDAIDVDEGMDEAIRVLAEGRHTRAPVFDGSIDTVIGTVNALEITRAIAERRLDRTRLRDILRPPFLVPETKRVAELLAEFRNQKQKMAIVVDEYGGTAGIVTLADVLAEIVGDIRDEYAETEEPMRDLGNGKVEVQAAVHVSDVNEALGLDIPEEEDYETLGGYVLAELGHFPKAGDVLRQGEVSYEIVEASDRRILKVLVNRSA